MSRQLRLLLVEDSETDAGLIIRLLTKAGFEVTFQRVETAEMMRRSLEGQAWDAVISDYRLPQFNAAKALEILNRSELDIPFIIVSGMIGEEIAVAMMKAGAADYLIKSNLTRLAPAVERELREAQIRRERKKALAALAAEKERLHVTLRSIGDAVITTDVNGNVTLMNRVAEKLTGWSLAEALDRPLMDVFNIISDNTGKPCDNPVEKVLKSGAVSGLPNPTALLSRDGNRYLIADSGGPIFEGSGAVIGVVLVFRDVTAQKKTEEALRKADKLQSIGVLAGGIAHDFNNLLTAAFGNIEMARFFCTSHDVEKISLHLSTALSVFYRAKDLTRQLLTFSKGGKPVKKVLMLGPIIRKASQFVLSGSNIPLEFKIPDDLWQCEVDENQISQVIDNIVINGMQAMPNGGTITISAENVVARECLPIILPPGDYVRLAIHDQGAGIPREVLASIFDPFYSTKSLGTGLGLTIAYSIMKNHDGCIEVESDPEGKKGTTFFLFLPRSLKPVTTPEPRIAPLPPRKGERILIMDDETGIQDFVKNVLETNGHTVVCAGNGDEAIEIFRNALRVSNPFSLVILDLTIPGGRGGKEIISELKTLDPRVKSIVSSGYCDDPIMSNPAQYGFSSRLAKPYSMDEMLKTVRNLFPGN